MMVQGKPKTIGSDVTVAEVMETVEKDRNYFRRSGGGLTLSGGESLCQPEFARDLLKAAKENGISTALESMACVPYKNIAGVLPYLDQYLLDIKHMNGKKHQEYTGMSNELILENAGRIAAAGTAELSVRIPVVPTFNDTPEEITAIAVFARSLEHVKRIHLLPYHRLGQDKYDGLGREYHMEAVLPPSGNRMNQLLAAAEAASGLECQIGG